MTDPEASGRHADDRVVSRGAGPAAPAELPCLGIDLGTTFSAVAVLGPDGAPLVIPNREGARTTPSVVWFDGRQAWVGQKAELRKDHSPQHIFEFVKRSMGRPVEIPESLADDPDAVLPPLAPYAVAGFKYGAAGISALILRRLKKDAIRYFRREGLIAGAVDEEALGLDAVITVPAYFGDVERQQTRMAGYAAGLQVRAILNEPTAAALTYGMAQRDPRRLLVFDLGGGTFDVTILETGRDGSATVIATEGDHNLGGYNIDEIVAEYLLDRYEAATGASVPEEHMVEVWTAARDAKIALSDRDEAFVELAFDPGELQITLHRARPDAGVGMADYEMDDGDAFYLEDRIAELLQRCRTAAERALDEAASHPSRGGRPLAWGDIDEVILAGGSCRIPVVRRRLAEWTGRPVRRTDQFDLDTAVAIGAALYGTHQERVSDVLAQSVGVEVEEDGRRRIDRVLEANAPLPASGQRTYEAPANAMVVVREGDAEHADEAVERGRLHLGNPQTAVTVTLRADADGILTALAAWDGSSREVPIRNELFDFDDRAVRLREKVAAVQIKS